jgi:type IV pilus assembly protein PilB
MKAKLKRRVDKKLGQIMIELGFISKEQLSQGLAAHDKEEKRSLIGKILLGLGFVTEENVICALSAQYPLPYLPLDNYSVNPEAVSMVSRDIADRHVIVPIEKMGRNLTIAMSNPLDLEALAEIELASQCSVQPVIATASEILRTISRYYSDDKIKTFPMLPHDSS